jgi:hypothetical protein
MSDTPKSITDALKEQARKGGCSQCDKMRGLGDAIAKLTSAVGIQPCGGCKKRQEMLNKIVPFSAGTTGSNG